MLFGEIPLWLHMDDGKNSIENKDYGNAVKIFREILKKNPYDPEVRKWLGYIYNQEGEYDLAIKEYERALEYKKNMIIPEDEFSILYSLAELYKTTHDKSEYIFVLNQIIDSVKSEKLPLSTVSVMVSVLVKSGIDKFFELYRPTAKITVKAHYLLGIYYFKEKKYTESLYHLIFAIGEPVQEVIKEIILTDPDYKYVLNKDKSPIDDLLQRVSKIKKLNGYFKNINFFNALFYTGKAVVYTGNKKSGMEIIKLVMSYSPELSLRNKARLFFIK